MCAELGQIQRLGWRSSVFMADDNFIGNKKNVRLLLPRLAEWMQRLKMLFTCGELWSSMAGRDRWIALPEKPNCTTTCCPTGILEEEFGWSREGIRARWRCDIGHEKGPRSGLVARH